MFQKKLNFQTKICTPWGVNIVHMKIWFTPLDLSRFNYYKCKLRLKMDMISSISGNPIILVYICIIYGIGALARQ